MKTKETISDKEFKKAVLKYERDYFLKTGQPPTWQEFINKFGDKERLSNLRKKIVDKKWIGYVYSVR